MNKNTKKNKKNDIFKKELEITKQCPICKKKYPKDIIAENENLGEKSWLHITCPNCQNSMIMIILSNQFGIGVMALATDLTAHDIKKFKNKKPITSDELLEIYSIINNNKKII